MSSFKGPLPLALPAQRATTASLPPSMMKRTHDHARPPRATSSTTATQHVYIVNTTARALLEPSLLFGPCHYDFVCDVTRFTHLVTSHPPSLSVCSLLARSLLPSLPFSPVRVLSHLSFSYSCFIRTASSSSASFRSASSSLMATLYPSDMARQEPSYEYI
jgi:hypothetical protein